MNKKQSPKTIKKFVVFKTYKLDFLGSEWQDCFLKFKSISYEDSLNLRKTYDLVYTKEQIMKDPEVEKKVATNTLKFLKDYYVDGLGFDGTAKVQILPDDLEALPVDVLVNAFYFLSGAEGDTHLKG